uniref:Uncharacterized protein n=1 Tax=Cacopsylla melanoneura TaxID=428564 RepID=A0A8D8WCN0_9HEMI
MIHNRKLPSLFIIGFYFYFIFMPCKCPKYNFFQPFFKNVFIKHTIVRSVSFDEILGFVCSILLPHSKGNGSIVPTFKMQTKLVHFFFLTTYMWSSGDTTMDLKFLS